MRDPALYLKDILESIDLIEQFVSNMEFEDFTMGERGIEK